MPWKWARVLMTSMLCGNRSQATKNFFTPAFTWARLRECQNISMASAAAVPSSSKLALANGMAVRSLMTVW